jgi:2-hydroxychromene-2-carboxylate isomerase
VSRERPRIYFDLGSPYAYLAVERASAVLARTPDLVPVLLGAIFQWRGSGSSAMTSQRADRVRELERRARNYGLPPVVWPKEWPANGLAAMRAATWARRNRRGTEFASSVYRQQFGAGADISDTRGWQPARQLPASSPRHSNWRFKPPRSKTS